MHNVGRTDFDESVEDIEDEEISDDLVHEIKMLKRRNAMTTRLIARLERAVFGYENEKMLWIPGILQNTADLVQIVALGKKVFWRASVLIIGMLFLNLLHSYGLSEPLVKWLVGAFSAVAGANEVSQHGF
jgi:DUF438 domain-containing protein